jgi:IS1 family transposase
LKHWGSPPSPQEKYQVENTEDAEVIHVMYTQAYEGSNRNAKSQVCRKKRKRKELGSPPTKMH